MAATRTPAQRYPGAPVGRRRSSDGQVLGAMLVIGGVAWLLGQTGLLELSATTVLSALLLVLGAGMVATPRSAGGGGLVVLGLVLTVALASATAVDVGLLQRGVGERSFRPTTTSEITDPFQLGIGAITLDLTDLDADELAGQRVEVQVGVGELVVLLPPASVVPIDLVAEARAGEIDLFSERTDDGGTNLRRLFADETGPEGAPTLELDLDVGLGSIQVVRAPSA
jgi:hypothetical protein